MQTLKIGSFNIRLEADRGANAFPMRAPYIKAMLAEEQPDIIGFQEVSPGIVTWLNENLSDVYELVGCTRSEDAHPEAVTVAFRRDRFHALTVRNVWLSATPAVMGSRYGLDQSACPRMFTSVRLLPRNGGKPFLFYNTHLDHQGELARLCGAMQILQDVSLQSEPFILTGDFNALPASREIELIRNFPGRRIIDATEQLGDTYHGYEKDPAELMKIDYIFTDGDCDPTQSYLIPPKPVDGTYLSDHCPVFGFVTL